jgi:flavoprotein
MGTTDDPTDPRLTRGVDDAPRGQAEVYLVLSDAERAAGFVRPVRRSYLHQPCSTVTTMAQRIAETYARDPSFYGSTYCGACRQHRPVGADGEFTWDDGTGQRVGT